MVIQQSTVGGALAFQGCQWHAVSRVAAARCNSAPTPNHTHRPAQAAAATSEDLQQSRPGCLALPDDTCSSGGEEASATPLARPQAAGSTAAAAGAVATLPAVGPSRSAVLVAKRLTSSDAASGRVILPRLSVERNLPFILGYRHYQLTVRDRAGGRHEFMIKSWANGTEHRRVYVLEQAAEFLRARGLGPGDTLGICADEHGGSLAGRARGCCDFVVFVARLLVPCCLC